MEKSIYPFWEQLANPKVSNEEELTKVLNELDID